MAYSGHLKCLLGISLLLLPLAAQAQDAPSPTPQRSTAATPAPTPPPVDHERHQGPQQRPSRDDQSNASTSEPHHLPPDSTTKQVLTLPGRTLSFTATAGSIRIFDDKNEPQADIVYSAYQLDDSDTRTRPVTFVFNGGPGASSAWLQFGNFGPWRIGMSGDALSPSATPDLTPNAETWLDFTDLVFIDPVGTGYSRFVATGDDVRKRFYSVDGDASSLALMIRRWLEKSNRLVSPKYLVGESYGGIRGPKIVRDLQTHEGIGVKGLILVSPVLDFREFSGSSLMQYVASLPSMTAVAREAKGPVTRADMADAEAYAQTDFLLDLVRGEANTEATNRIADKVAALTGIDPAVTHRLAGRLSGIEFRREFDRRDGRVTGRYDASVTGLDPYPDSDFFRFGDPASDPLIAPITSAAVDFTTRKLNWRPEGSYALLSDTVERNWDWGRGIEPPESIDQIRQMLAADPHMHLLVAHGLFDLATPYLGSKIALDQVPAYASPDRVKLVVYPGGHMFYSRDASRQALRAEAEALMK